MKVDFGLWYRSLSLIQWIFFWINKSHVFLGLLIYYFFKFLKLVRGVFNNLLHFLNPVNLIITLRFLCFWVFFLDLITKFCFFDLRLIFNRFFITLTINLFKHMLLINIKIWWHFFFFWWYVPQWIFWFLIYTCFFGTFILSLFFVHFHLFILFYNVLFKFKGFLWCTIIIVVIVLYIVFDLLLVYFLGF